MSAVKKYAGLPDLDQGTEIYETAVPELTEASTIPTDADSLSDDGNHNPNFIRQELDPSAARQRFEPYHVDATNVNFSDTIDGGRRDYQIRSRRRRRRAALTREQQDEYLSDESEEETIQGRLARLKREVAELQAEVETIENKEERRDEDGDSDYEDTVDHQTLNTHELARGTEELRGRLVSITTAHRKQKGMTLEDEFTRKLRAEDQRTKPKRATRQEENLSLSSLSGIAAFSDRLTLLETALGVTPATQSQPVPSPIVPTLVTLSTQIETLHSVLSPVPEVNVEGVTGSLPLTSTVHLDPIAEKIRFLVSEAKRLEDSRKAATKSFEELLETRDRHAHLFHSHSVVHDNTENRLSHHLSSQNVNGEQDQPRSVKDRNNQSRSTINDQFTPLFLDSQASKISALHNVLPTIQSMQPLLPVVLERLRALSVIHAGAADVKADMDDFESRLAAQEDDISTWEEALENAEKVMQENKVIMKENVEVVGGRVRGLEERVRSLGNKKSQ